MQIDSIKTKGKLYDFFMGKYYPIIVALLVTLGHISQAEIFFCIINVALVVTAFCICDSVRPMMLVLISFSYQISTAHSPAVPTFSDYYFTGWRLAVIIALGLALIFGIVFFIIKNHLISKISLKSTRLLIPCLILSAAFLLNGVFSENHNANGFIFGTTQIIIYLVLFLLLYLGFSERESADELVDYVSYITLIVAYMIIAQMVHLFVFGDVISGGEINSDNINLGWVTKNPLGAILVSLIPLLFYGAIKKARGIIYLATAVLTWIFTLLTCSRNAILFGTLIFGICLLICCFKGGERRRRFILLAAGGFVAVILGGILLREQLTTAFQGILNLGFNNNGRFKLWAQAWSLFCESPIFGSGFFTIVDPDVYIAVEVMPTMAHNTIFELLCSMGIFGLLAYGYYRVEIIKMALIRPSLAKTFLTITVFSIAVLSLLDCFVFFYYTLFLPMAALAVLCRICDEEENGKTE